MLDALTTCELTNDSFSTALYDVGDIVHSVRTKWGIKANCPCANKQFKALSKPTLKEDSKQVLLLSYTMSVWYRCASIYYPYLKAMVIDFVGMPVLTTTANPTMQVFVQKLYSVFIFLVQFS